MKDFAEGLMWLLFASASISIMLFIAGKCEVWYSVAFFLIGALFGVLAKFIKNQERIIELIENKNKDSEDKENKENRAE